MRASVPAPLAAARRPEGSLPGPWSGGYPRSWKGIVTAYLRASMVFMISSHSDI